MSSPYDSSHSAHNGSVCGKAFMRAGPSTHPAVCAQPSGHTAGHPQLTCMCRTEPFLRFAETSFQVAYHHGEAHLYFVNHNESQQASKDPWNLHMSLIDLRPQHCQAGHLGQLKHTHTWLACPNLSHAVSQVLSVIPSELKCLHLTACRSQPESTHLLPLAKGTFCFINFPLQPLC